MTIRQHNAKYYFYLLLIRDTIGITLSLFLICLSGMVTAFLYFYYTAPALTPMTQAEWFDFAFLSIDGLIMLLTGLYSFHEFLYSWRYKYTQTTCVLKLEKIRQANAKPYLPRSIQMLKTQPFRRPQLTTLDLVRGINL